ncbi:MAG: VTT domain-containing protein [Oscillospiraceae bacterium]|nr:VTT domain-containing protein [Oscillospiraceae bacterium]
MRILKRKFERKDAISIAALLLILGLMIYLGLGYSHILTGIVEPGGSIFEPEALVASAEQMRDWIQDFGSLGILVLTAINALQVVISAIPAALVQFFGGAFYGIWGGLFIGSVGTLIGTVISFYISRVFGRRVVTLFVSEKNLQKIEGLLSTNTSTLILLFLYIIPCPKDFFPYFLGLTSMKARKVFLLSTIGRIPGMLITVWLGAHVYDGNVKMLVAVTAAVAVVSLGTVVFKDKLLKLISPKSDNIDTREENHMKKLKIGMLSSWHVHAGGYAGDIQNSGLAEIAAVWDEDPARGAAWAEELGAAFEPDADALLAREDIDAVVCCSPTTMHPALLAKAARAGKHIFTEKLLAVTAAEARELCRVIGESGVIFTIGLSCKADRAIRCVQRMAAEGKLGRVTGGRFRRSHSGVSENWLPERWYDLASSGGGAMMDLGAHPVYIMAWLFGTPKRLSCLMSNIYGTTGDENAIILAEFAEGVIGTCETAFVTDGVPDLLEVYGTQGAAFMRGGELHFCLAAEDRQMRPAREEELPAEEPQPLLQFLQACANGTGEPEGYGLDEALQLTRIIEAGYLSNETGKTTEL